MNRREREVLASRVQALELALAGLGALAPDAPDALRRLAGGMPELAAIPGATEASVRVASCGPDALGEAAASLVRVLRAALTEAPEDRYGVLIAEDDPALREAFRGLLASDSRRLHFAATGAEVERLLREEEITLLLLDPILPDMDGRALLARLRERPATAALPVLVVSGRCGPQAMTECFALGIVGYFEKPVDPEVLRAAVGAQLHRESKIRREIRNDALTGLLNRAGFVESFGRLQLDADRRREPLSLAILDLDHFKEVNDAYGHSTGDRLLRRFAACVSETLRKTDLVARWGGDEFVALLPNSTAAGALRAFQTTLARVRAEPFASDDGRPFPLSFSGGVSEVVAGATVDEAVGAADRLLYLAKEAGRNRIVSLHDAPPSSRPRILVAEDETLIALLVRQVLEKAGFEVLHCPDGNSALEAAFKSPLSLALLDVNMPGLNGFDVLRRIRATASLARLPVVLFTTMGGENDIVRGFELGADDYVVKPFVPGELVARLRRLLRRR